MNLKVFVEKKQLRIAVGQGYGDFRWLALAATHLYGKVIYPKGRYLPILLTIEKNSGGEKQTFEPHPRKKINSLLTALNCVAQQLTVFVKVRELEQRYKQEQLRWERLAFGEGRNIMDLFFHYQVDKITKSKGYKFKVQISYVMNQEVMNEFLDSNEFKPRMEIIEEMSEVKHQNRTEYEFSISLPFGTVRHNLLYVDQKDQTKKSTKIEYQTPGSKNTNYTFFCNPNVISKKEVQDLIKNDMRMPEHLSRQLEIQEMESKKKSGNSLFCCYTAERLWQIIQEKHDKDLDISSCEQSIKDRISIAISKNLNKLYEIFFQYVIIYYQQKSEKEELCITYQDVMHFLKFYEVLPSSQAVQNFFEIFNSDDKIIDLSDTLSLQKNVDFPEFVMIILKVVHFNNVTHMSQGVTFDSTAQETINKIVRIDSNQEEFNELHKSMRENHKLINFIRENSHKFISVFKERLENTVHVSESKYHMIMEDVKALLVEAGIDSHETNDIVIECYKQLFQGSPKYKNFQGIYYFQFLQVMQWLSHILTGMQSEQAEEDNIEALINKLEFFMGQIYNQKSKRK